MEIQGPPVSGKTHLLYFLLFACVLPPVYNENRLEGWGRAAFILDAGGAFQIAQFTHFLKAYIMRRLPRCQDQEISDILLGCLSRFHVFTPESTAQLAVTILSLPDYHAKTLPRTEMGILAIDTMSAFYWQDRFMGEQPCWSSMLAARLNHQPLMRTDDPMRHVWTALDSVARSYCPLVVFTNWALHRNKHALGLGDTNLYSQHIRPSLLVPSDDHECQTDPTTLLLRWTHRIALATRSMSRNQFDNADCGSEGSFRIKQARTVVRGVIQTETNTWNYFSLVIFQNTIEIEYL